MHDDDAAGDTRHNGSAVPLIARADGHPGQLGFVVENMDVGLATWGSMGHTRDGWRIWRYDPSMVADMTYRGRRSDYAMWLAFSGADPQIELIEPIEGPSIYSDWLETHGPGLNHLGFYVDDVDEVTADMKRAGFEMVQSGRAMGADGSGGYAYYDTTDLLGVYLEAIEVPRRRRDPHRIWPEETA